MSCEIQPARHNHQPTGHQMNRQGLYVPKKAYFLPNLAFFRPKILIFVGGRKSFGTLIMDGVLTLPPRYGRRTTWAMRSSGKSSGGNLGVGSQLEGAGFRPQLGRTWCCACLLYVVGAQSEFGACVSINILEGALHFIFLHATT